MNKANKCFSAERIDAEIYLVLFIKNIIMKKKSFFKLSLIALFVLASGYNMFQSKTEVTDAMTDLLIDNVEALAYPEWMYDGWYLTNVTQNSHTCLPGGAFSCV